MRFDPVTTRWTEALFTLAQRAGVVDEVGRDMQRLGEEVSGAGVRDFLLGGQVSRADKAAKLEGVLTSFHPFSRDFVRLCFDRRREEVLLSVSEAFRQRNLAERGVVEGVVECARPLDAAELSDLAADLGRRLGKEVSLRAQSNPELVGGVRVIVGASMIDQTVQGRLEGLRHRLQAARLTVG